MNAIFFLIWFNLSSTAMAEEPTRVVLDKIVAVVGRRVITLSDIKLENQLKSIHKAAFSPFERRREAPMDFLLEIQILRRLAGEVPLYRPKAVEIKERMKTIKQHWQTTEEYESFLDQVGITNNRLEGIIITQITAEKYAQKNLGASTKETKQELYDRYVTWIDLLKTKAEYRIVDPRYLGKEPPLINQ